MIFCRPIFQSNSPSDSDMTALGIYLLSSLVFTVAALLEFAVVIVADRLNTSQKQHVPSKVGIQCTNYFDNQSLRKRNIAGRKPNWFEMGNNGLGEGTHDKTNAGQPYFSVDKIDAAAFWSYLIIYILFNIVYWVFYLN